MVPTGNLSPPVTPPPPLLGVQVDVDEGSLVESVETKESQSYPGLISQYTCWRVCACIPGGQLPEGPFCTDEERPDGLLQHSWRWR